MRSHKLVLLAIALACAGLLAGALYLQLAKDMLPCPLCVIQRYLFIAIGLLCLLAAFAPHTLQRSLTALAVLPALGGLGVALHHVEILSTPQMSCGIDPLETGLNKIFLVDWWPAMFRADGLCDAPYPPTLGLSLPAWTAIWYGGFAVVLIVLFFTAKRPGLFGRRSA